MQWPLHACTGSWEGVNGLIKLTQMTQTDVIGLLQEFFTNTSIKHNNMLLHTHCLRKWDGERGGGGGGGEGRT